MRSWWLSSSAAALSFAVRFSGAHAVTLAVVFAAYASSGPLVAGVVTAARSLPSVLVPWLSGWWYDRRGPRSLLVAVGALDVVAVCLAPSLAASTLGLTVVAAALGLSAAVFDTTVTATVANAGASPLRASVLTGLAFDAGKAVAALLALWLATSGWATLVAAALVAFGALGQVVIAPSSPPDRERGPAWGSWMRPLVPVLVTAAVLNVSVGALLFWQATLGRNTPMLFTAVSLALALGAVAGNLVLARVGLSRSSMRVGIAVSALGLLVASFPSAPPGVVLAAVFVWGLGVAWWFQVVRAWVVSSAPMTHRGRAGTLFGVTTRIVMTVSPLLLGSVLSVTTPAVLAGVVVLVCLTAALGAPRQPRWRIEPAVSR